VERGKKSTAAAARSFSLSLAPKWKGKTFNLLQMISLDNLLLEIFIILAILSRVHDEALDPGLCPGFIVAHIAENRRLLRTCYAAIFVTIVQEANKLLIFNLPYSD
jgi:hypothetical protein